MAIANGTCVSFCNQPKAHYLATSRESRRYVVAFSLSAGAGIWLRQESLIIIIIIITNDNVAQMAHFSLPWVRP